MQIKMGNRLCVFYGLYQKRRNKIKFIFFQYERGVVRQLEHGTSFGDEIQPMIGEQGYHYRPFAGARPNIRKIVADGIFPNYVIANGCESAAEQREIIVD